ncbi:uncharacterized protein K460DRAFT_48568 [Cucurbitaria berberidis CBS 394.84]|uniref:Uncharacterized protein n=1 Tax=Cucurbitaria berberidis CBS 394.84 TaxID=1168544 RepID=A0A9P4LFL4_9PLEO|nr:uncharacterized protein K460DRAFT_48568 [Cucurbitaria berberidis CBS 394.84]KAF1852199.1 hypothetical protein K460DRAFT_48568 [Cucurbitaria berberidis CBS 394.84]
MHHRRMLPLTPNSTTTAIRLCAVRLPFHDELVLKSHLDRFLKRWSAFICAARERQVRHASATALLWHYWERSTIHRFVSGNKHPKSRQQMLLAVCTWRTSSSSTAPAPLCSRGVRGVGIGNTRVNTPAYRRPGGALAVPLENRPPSRMCCMPWRECRQGFLGRSWHATEA